MRKLTIPGTTLEKEVGEGFNRAALAFGAFWYFYKGMWLRGLLYTIVALIAPGISWIFVWVYAGFRANQEYYEHLVKKGYRDSTDSTVAASTAVTKQTDLYARSLERLIT